MLVRLFLFCFLLLCRPSFAIADKPNDSIPSSAKSLDEDFSQWCRVGNHIFYLERISLSEIAKRFGKGMVVNTDANDPGDADPLWAVLYQDGGNVIRFESDGDIGGPEHTLTGVTVVPTKKYPSADKLPSIDGSISFDFGPLGMSLRRLEHNLGKTDLQSGSAFYTYAGRVPAKDVDSLRESVKEGKKSGATVFDVTGYLRAGIVDGTVVSIEMTHVTTF